MYIGIKVLNLSGPLRLGIWRVLGVQNPPGLGPAMVRWSVTGTLGPLGTTERCIRAEAVYSNFELGPN